MDNKIKILFCGDVEGKFNTLFNRVESINKKSGPFSMLLCVGNFFGVNNKEFDVYKSGQKTAPIPTYILGPNKDDHLNLYNESEFEICPNIYYLGKRGLYTSSQGLKIAYMSGIGNTTGGEIKDFQFTAEDIQNLRDSCLRGNSNFRGVDILLTSEWPQNILNNTASDLHNTKSEIGALFNESGTYLNSWLAIHLKPRYHVCGLLGQFYERPPFRTLNTSTQDDFEIVTRFIALARVGNQKKDKWIYALNLTPLDKMKISELVQKTTDETDCPYNLFEIESRVFTKGVKKRKTGNELQQQYFYDMSAPSNEKQNKKRQKRDKIVFDQDKCWFCLASSSIEKHLIVTVATATYLALAKGGLVDEHFLICPIEHYQCSIGQPETVSEEVEKFKEALRQFYGRDEKVPVFFERNYKTSHMQIQAVPIPNNAQRELKEIFLEEAEGHGIQLNELESHNRLEQVVPNGCPYFAVELPMGVTLYTRVSSAQNFPLNFGREVLASGPILNMSDRIEWKDCVLSKEAEDDLVKRIRTDFEPFDFTEL